MVDFQLDTERLLQSLDKLVGVKKKAKSKEHKLKWKIPEARLTVPLEDAEATVSALEKKVRPRFLSGGQYSEEVHGREFGQGIYSYMLVRTDKKTEQETIVAEPYMIQEEEKLGLDVASAYKIMDDLDQMGYNELFSREYTVWRFMQLEIPINVYSIEGLGDFLELGLPPTNFEHQREAAQKKADALVEKLGLDKEKVIPTDVITLQLANEMDKKQAAQKRR